MFLHARSHTIGPHLQTRSTDRKDFIPCLIRRKRLGWPVEDHVCNIYQGTAARYTNGERLLVIIRTTQMECCTRCDLLRQFACDATVAVPDDCQRIEHPVICTASRTPEKIQEMMFTTHQLQPVHLCALNT